MSQLTMAAQPGFTDLADSAIAGGQPLTDTNVQAISHNAKFGIVRPEMFYMGFFTSGNTVTTPVSPVDGYTYARAECSYIPIFASSRQPAGGFTPGQAAFPNLAGTDLGAGSLIAVPYQLDINDTTGALTCNVYFSGNASQAQGTVKVYCIAMRSSVNVSD